MVRLTRVMNNNFNFKGLSKYSVSNPLQNNRTSNYKLLSIINRLNKMIKDSTNEKFKLHIKNF